MIFNIGLENRKNLRRMCFISFVILAIFLGGCADIPQKSIDLPKESLQTTTAESARRTDKTRPPEVGRESTQEDSKDLITPIEEIPLAIQNLPPEALLKEAQFFSDLSKEYWDKKNYEAAKELLDKAYAYLLAIKKQDDKELNKEIDKLRLTISRRIQELHAVQHTKVEGISSEIPLVLNDKVMREIRSFQGPEREFFIRSYERSRKYIQDIKRQFKEAGLPEELAWLPLIESGFNTKAYSPARALGLWQFIPSTGARFGLSRDKWVDERMDPEKSTKAAIAYLKALHNLFGDWHTALAAYNCGEGLVLRTIREQKINYLDNFWDLYERLPEQTARFVPRFLAALHIIKDPEKYGFDFSNLQDHEPLEIEKILVDKPIHLRSLAEMLKIPHKQLIELNPELRLEITPDRPYELKVPASEAENCRICISQLKELNYAERLAMIKVDDISNTKKVVEAKKLDDKQKPSPKQLIINSKNIDPKNIIPGQAKAETQAQSKPLEHSKKSDIKDKKNPNETSNKVYKTYQVKKGDTLYSIAKKNNTTVELLMQLNNLKTPQELKDGLIIKLP